MAPAEAPVIFGRIASPYGLQGWLKVHPLGDDPQRWGTLHHWWVRGEESSEVPWHQRPLRDCKVRAKDVLVLFADVADRTAAEQLAGHWVAAPLSQLPRDEDEFFWGQLVNLSVVNREGICLGTIRRLLATPAHAVLEVVLPTNGTETKDQVRLLPCVSAVVETIDLERALVQVNWQADW